MDVSDPRYRKLVEEFANDDEFLQFDEATQDSILDIAMQKRYGAVPKTEGLLGNAVQQVIRNSRMGPHGGSSITAALPTTGEEAMDFGKVVGRQLPGARGGGVGFAEQGPMGIGLNMAGIKKQNEIIPSPQTEYGKNLESSADIAPLAALGLEGGGAITGGIKNLIKSLKLGNLPKEIQKIESEIGKFKNKAEFLWKQLQKAKSSRKNLRNLNIREGQDLTVKGMSKITSEADKLFDTALENYKSRLLDIDPKKVSVEDFVKTIDKTLEAKGAVGASYNSPQELALRQIRDRLVRTAELTEETPAVMDIFGTKVLEKAKPASIKFKNLSRPSELKYFQDEIYRATSGRKDLQGEFLKHFGEMAEKKGASGINDANALYKNAYKVYDDVSKIKQPALKRISLGSPHISEGEIRNLQSLESGLGTNVVRNVRSQGEKALTRQNKLEKYIERTSRRKLAKESEIPLLESKKQAIQMQLDKIAGRQSKFKTIGKVVGAGALGGGAFKAGSSIFDLFFGE